MQRVMLIARLRRRAKVAERRLRLPNKIVNGADYGFSAQPPY